MRAAWVEREDHEDLVVVFASNFQAPPLQAVFLETGRVVEPTSGDVRSHHGQTNLFDERAGMSNNLLHEGCRQARPTCLRPDVHSPQHALMPQLRRVMRRKSGYADEWRIVHPAAEDGGRLQAFGPPGD